MRRALLVPRQDVPESALLEDFVINRDDRSARVTENLRPPSSASARQTISAPVIGVPAARAAVSLAFI